MSIQSLLTQLVVLMILFGDIYLVQGLKKSRQGHDREHDDINKYTKEAQVETDQDERLTRKARKKHLDNIYKEELAISSSDKKEAIATYKTTIDAIVTHVRKQDGGKVYKADVRKAGGHAQNAKVSKADEFDTNIILDLKVERVRTSGDLPYIYKDKKKGSGPINMNADRELIAHPGGTIPPHYASVEVADTTPGYLTYKGDLIAHKVKKDLYNKVSTAVQQLHLENVQLSKYSHGPALTLKIKRGTKHDIDVDMTASVPWDKLSVTDHGWPRPDTLKVYKQKQIKDVIDAGMHLVPKGDETWAISFSKAETALLETIDGENGCRKAVLKHLKRFAQICKSRVGGLPGFSSHILKHQVLWSSEKNSESDYWHAKNIDICLMDTMKDMEQTLNNGILPDYFDPSQNILVNKEHAVLIKMANFLRKERLKLENM